MGLPGFRERMERVADAVAAFDPADTGADFAQARDAFYTALSDLAGNDQLRTSLLSVRVHLIRVQFRAVLHATHHLRQACYRRIARAVLAGRPKEAQAAAHAHFDRALVALVAFRAS